MPREKVKIALPFVYDGRCSDKEKCFTFYPTFGQSAKLSDDAKIPGFEMRLPIPESDEDAQSFYNRSIRDLVLLGLAKLSTDLDGWKSKKGDILGVKGILFDGIPEPFEVEENTVSDDTHVEAQKWLDEWRWSPPSKSDKRAVSANAIESELMAAGIITADEIGKYTGAELIGKLRDGLTKTSKKGKK